MSDIAPLTQAEQPLVELRTEHLRAPSAGLRVWPDGRVESFSGITVAVDASGSAQVKVGEPVWKAASLLDSSKLDALQRAMRESGVLGLHESYGAPGEVDDPAVTTWRFSLDGQTHIVRVTGSQFVKPPELEAFRQQLDQLRLQPRQSWQLWRVREGEQTVERTLRCGPHDIPAFSEVLRALYSSEGFEPGQGRPLKPSKIKTNGFLLEIRYFENGVDGGKVFLYPDGRLTESDAGSEQQKLMRTLSPETLAEARARIAAAALGTFPDPACGIP